MNHKSKLRTVKENENIRYGSVKISLYNVDKILNDKKMTSYEITIYLWLTLKQDSTVFIELVKYNELIKDLKIRYQEYYNYIYGLE